MILQMISFVLFCMICKSFKFMTARSEEENI